MDNLFDYVNQVLERCDSTNNIAKKLAEAGYPHGTWVSTRIQDLGRGRLGRKWESIEGNLFLSVVARIENKTLWSWVPLATAIAVIHFLRKKFPSLDFRVKWPNDLWLLNAKLGGILCEGAGSSSNPYIIIGIGVNCVGFPENIDQAAIDLTSALGKGIVTANDIRSGIILNLMNELSLLSTQGPTPLIEAYNQSAVFSPGTEVQWGIPLQAGIVEGLGHSGELCVYTTAGERMSLFAEDVRVVRKFLCNP